MKKVGFFFGTFNPVHVGHLIIANHIVQHTDLEEVHMVVSPHNPHKQKDELLDDAQRLAMVGLAVADNPNLHASNIEFDMPQPSYTVHTLERIRKELPAIEPVLIMGGDNLRSFHKWYRFQHILDTTRIYVYPRVQTIQEAAGTTSQAAEEVLNHPNIRLINSPILQVSATAIRNAIAEGKDVRYVVTEPVYDYLQERGFYAS